MNASVKATVKAAVQILEKSGPMYYKDLAKKLFATKAITPRGKDPVYTVYADLFWDSKSEKPTVKMIGRGVYTLATDQTNTDGSVFAPSREQTPPSADDLKKQIARLQKQLEEMTATK